MVRIQDLLVERYELLDVLGRGGMGLVYRATDRLLERTVAVKVLPVDRAADPMLVARFEREALAAAALSHPNIVAVFDSGQDGDIRFIVMEHVVGESLAQVIARRGRVAAGQAVHIASQVASALAAAHRAGIVHRDIKPANVMVDDQGTVKVLDFGIARLASSASLTDTATVLGSAPYLAPEVIQGEPADARSDVYSLGCVLYELLTGHPPFGGELPAAILHQHVTAIPPGPGEVNPAVPAALDALVMRTLAKDPNRRPQDGQELAQALPVSLDRTTAITLAVTGARRRGRLRLLEKLALALAALLVIVGVSLALLGSSGSPTQSGAGRITHSATHAAAAGPGRPLLPALEAAIAALGSALERATPAPHPAPPPVPEPDRGPKGRPPGHGGGRGDLGD